MGIANDEVILKRIMKKNVIELAKHHRKNCDGEHCKISLMILCKMSEKAGITFTEYQKKEYFV